MVPRKDFEEEKKLPSKRNWQRRPERGDEQPRDRKAPRPKRPDEVVWDWEDDDEVDLDDAKLDDEADGEDEDQDDVVWDDDDR